MKYCRIRFRNHVGAFTERAWAEDIVGIWYGAWPASVFNAAERSANLVEFLSSVPAPPDAKPNER